MLEEDWSEPVSLKKIFSASIKFRHEISIKSFENLHLEAVIYTELVVRVVADIN